MFKNARKLLSAILSLTLAAGVVCALPASAENAEINPQEHLRLISSCSNFAAAVCTDKTPDGKGFKVSVANKNGAQNITKQFKTIENSLSFTRDSLEKGAFIIWFGHDKERNGETAYANNNFLFRYDDVTGYDMRLNGTASAPAPVYFISSADGTVLRNDVINTATGLAMNADGEYFNEGYWVIPGSSLQLSKFTDDSSHELTLVQCSPTNKDRNNVDVSAAFEYYYDNLCFVDNIEDILGSKTGDDFAYGAGSTYPVYKLGFMTGRNGAEPNISAEGVSVTATGLSDGSVLNVYKNNGFIASAAAENGKAVINGLASGSYKFQTADIDENGKYRNVSETAAESIAEFDYSGLHILRDYTDLTAYDPATGIGNGTNNVPDGRGFITRTKDTDSVENFHPSFYKEMLTSETVNNGALVFYYKYDEERTVNGETKTAYADIVPSLAFIKEGDTANTVVSIKAATNNSQSVYFISSQDGTVIKNSTYNSSVQLAKSGDKYYNSGWWIVPLSAMKTLAGVGIEELGEEYKLNGVKFLCRNIALSGGFSKADCTFYLDNFAIIDNIEDILGAKDSDGNYTFDSGSVYPVYNLGALDTASSSPQFDKSANAVRTGKSLTVKRPAEYADSAWKLNVYINGKGLAESVKLGADVTEYATAEYNAANVRIQLICGGNAITVTDINRAGDIKDNGYLDLLDIIALKKLTVNSGTTYNSDIDGDGFTNSKDIALLKKMLLGVAV